MVEEKVIIEKTSRLLKKKYGATAVYIFGSYINGHYQQEKSDLDLAVFLPDYDACSFKRLAEIVYEVQNTISSKIELHFFSENVEPLTFSEYVIKNGRLIA